MSCLIVCCLLCLVLFGTISSAADEGKSTIDFEKEMEVKLKD